MAIKLTRFNDFVDPSTGIGHKQTLTHLRLSLQGNYDHQIGGNGKFYAKESKNASVDKDIPVPSIDELEEAAKTFPWLAPLVDEFMKKISAPFKGETEAAK